MATPLDYARRQPRRGAPWWLWTVAALSVLGLVCTSLPKWTGRPENARNAAARADVTSLKLALDTFVQDTGRYPTSLEGLGALIDAPAGSNNWHGPYLRSRAVVNDPWGRPYVYAPGPEGTTPRVISLGPDGKLGSADDIVWP
jgi:general secretion pathway protein G